MSDGIPKIVFSGLLATCLAVACGSNAEPPGGKNTPDGGADAAGDLAEAGQGLALQQYAGTFARVLCARVFACCPAADRQAFFGTTEADCAGKLELGEGIFINTIADDVTKGYIAYDGAKAAACFSVIAARSCDVIQRAGDFTESIADCQNHLLPKVALGGACLNNRDCIGGWCDASSGMKCVPAFSDGQPCDVNSQCKKGSTCAGSGLCAPEGNFCSGG